MANEAILRDRIDEPLNFTVSDSTAVVKGSLMKLTDPRTAIISSASADPIAGIAAHDKVASDGITSIGVFRRGIFDMVASGAVPVGSAVQSAGVLNEVKVAALTSSGATIVGYALETASDVEVFQVFVDVGCGGAQVS